MGSDEVEVASTNGANNHQRNRMSSVRPLRWKTRGFTCAAAPSCTVVFLLFGGMQCGVSEGGFGGVGRRSVGNRCWVSRTEVEWTVEGVDCGEHGVLGIARAEGE